MHTKCTLLSNDAAFNCVKVRDAADGETGVFLQKNDVLASASQSIKLTLTKLGPLILPLSELVQSMHDPGDPNV